MKDGAPAIRRAIELATLAMLALPWTIQLTSCANVRVRRMRSQEQDSEGIRFYRPHPYVLVRVEGDKITAQVVQLPDRDQEYLVDWSPGFGTVKPGLQLTDGWNLTAFNSDIATGASGLADLLKAAAAFVALEAPEPAEVKIGLIRLDWVPGKSGQAGSWKLGDAVEWKDVPSVGPTKPASGGDGGAF